MFKGRAKTGAETLRPMLFGNVPVEEWPAKTDGNEDGIVGKFIAARAALARWAEGDAVAIWQEIASTEGIEKRHVLQAWCFLRERGIQPDPTDGSVVLGVVVEVPVAGGTDVLAGYRDGTARYLNHSGRVAIVDGQLRSRRSSRPSLMRARGWRTVSGHGTSPHCRLSCPGRHD